MSGGTLRFTPAVVAVIAGSVLVMMAATAPWTRHGNPSRYDMPYAELAGSDYGQGLAAFGVGAALFALTAVYAARLASRKLWLLLPGGLSLAALALPLSIYAHTVTEYHRGVGSAERIWQNVDDIGATSGLSDSMVAAGIGLIAVIAASLTWGRWRPARTIRGSAYALTFASLSIAAVFMTWDVGDLRWSNYGFEYGTGLVGLVAALNAVLVSALGLSGEISERGYVRWSLPSGVVMLSAPVWFYFTDVGSADPAFDGQLINCFTLPCGTIDAGTGLLAALAFGAAYLASIMPVARSMLPTEARPAPAALNRGP